jgi:hypothetical protein
VVNVQYDEDVFDVPRIDWLGKAFLSVLSAMAARPESSLSGLLAATGVRSRPRETGVIDLEDDFDFGAVSG